MKKIEREMIFFALLELKPSLEISFLPSSVLLFLTPIFAQLVSVSFHILTDVLTLQFTRMVSPSTTPNSSQTFNLKQHVRYQCPSVHRVCTFIRRSQFSLLISYF